MQNGIECSAMYLLQKAADLRLSLPGSGEGGLVAVIAASAGYPGLFHRGYSASRDEENLLRFFISHDMQQHSARGRLRKHY